MNYLKKYIKYKYKYKKLKNIQNGGNFNNLINLTKNIKILNFEPNFVSSFNNINILQSKQKINFVENSYSSDYKKTNTSETSNNQLNKVIIKKNAIYINDTFTPNYLINPLSDHGAIKYDTTLIWNITQKGYEMDENSDVYTHKFMNLKNETDNQYNKRCYRIIDKIKNIIIKFPEIDVILLQELPNNLYKDIFYNKMNIEINDKSYVFLCNYYKTRWPTGIIFDNSKYYYKYLYIPNDLDNPVYKRMSMFLLTDYKTSINKIYISVHAPYDKGKTRDQYLINLMDILVKKLISIYNIDAVIFGGDFNAPFKNNLLSVFNPIIYTIPGDTVYSTSNNYGKTNSKQIDFIIIYNLQ